MMKRGHDVESAPGIWRWRTAVEHYAGIDVSLELSSVCVVDGRGKIVKEAKVASEPEALVYFFKELGFPVNGIGFEAGPLSQWLHAGLTQAGFETVLLETRHVKAALSARRTARMRVGLHSCCGWDGSSRCTPNRLDRRSWGNAFGARGFEVGVREASQGRARDCS